MVIRTRSIPMRFRAIHFANEIFARRLEMKMNGSDAAELLPFDKTTLYTYERGGELNLKMQNFLALCNLYDLNPAEFFELDVN